MPTNRYIVVEGVIGAGKTSLTRLLADSFELLSPEELRGYRRERLHHP